MKPPEITGTNSASFFGSISCFFCARGNEVEVEVGLVMENPSFDCSPKGIGNLFSAGKRLNKIFACFR